MENSITLRDLLLFEDEGLFVKDISRFESLEKLSSIKKILAVKARSIKWAAAIEEICSKTDDLLRIPIQDILVSAWNKYRMLSDIMEKSKASPNETFLVSVVEHTIKSEHLPYIEIMVNGKSIGKIDFNISVDLFLKGFNLKINNGKIKEIITGSCKGRGIIK